MVDRWVRMRELAMDFVEGGVFVCWDKRRATAFVRFD